MQPDADPKTLPPALIPLVDLLAEAAVEQYLSEADDDEQPHECPVPQEPPCANK